MSESSPRAEKIEFLFFVRDRLSDVDGFRNLTRAEFEALQASGDLDHIGEEWSALNQMSDTDLDSQFSQELAAVESDFETLCQTADGGRLAEFAQQDAWSLEEAVAISLGHEPRSGLILFSQWHEPLNATVKAIAERDRKVRAALSVNLLKEPVRPADFVAWALERNLDLPAPLVEVLEGLSQTRSALRARIEELEHLLSEQSDENLRLKKAFKALELPSYNTILKMLAVISIEYYKFMPSKQRNEATTRIESDLSRYGVVLGSGKVLKYIRMGRDMLPEKAWKTLPFEGQG